MRKKNWKTEVRYPLVCARPVSQKCTCWLVVSDVF